MSRATPPPPSASTIVPEVGAFLEQFDAYVAARVELRKAEDGSDDARYCIDRCASIWNSLLTARAQVKA